MKSKWLLKLLEGKIQPSYSIIFNRPLNNTEMDCRGSQSHSKSKATASKSKQKETTEPPPWAFIPSNFTMECLLAKCPPKSMFKTVKFGSKSPELRVKWWRRWWLVQSGYFGGISWNFDHFSSQSLDELTELATRQAEFVRCLCRVCLYAFNVEA